MIGAKSLKSFVNWKDDCSWWGQELQSEEAMVEL